MKAGKTASLTLLVILVALALVTEALATWVEPLRSAEPWKRIALGAGILAALYAIVLVPLGMAIDRALVSLRGCIEGAAATEQSFSFGAPRWLRPVMRSLSGAVDQFRQREQALRTQLRDIEIRHRVSEAERRQIEAVLHTLRDAVIVTDSFNEVVMANDAAAEALGFDLSAALHKPIDQVISDRKLRQMILDARDSANFNDCRHVEHELCTANEGGDASAIAGRVGSEARSGRFYDVALACIGNHKGEVSGVVTILRDLTRERELSQMKTDFVSKASHELRTPLSSIRAYVEMLVDGEAQDEKSRQEFYRIMHDETERLGRLIDNMLNISRIEAGIVQIDRENVDIKVLAERAINTLEPQAREKSITLHTKLADIALTVEGDADMLYQVLLNLISNSIKYTPEGGRVTISADSDNLTRSVLVSVSDTGLGIPPDSIPKLFDKFYRVENYKRVAKGTGLGLSLCKHIVETVHQGQIGVESKLGMGSRFWFAIPMRYAGSNCTTGVAA
ncbi:MAG TPA: ATP-binding protein [Phycisphaerales bacterium]|nr:ATP-binding protein [Phycisphaerales bacterium]HRQ76124.1 ATP-binding protein [Phycisphaerales bacterium]